MGEKMDTAQFRRFAATLDAESTRPELAAWNATFTAAAMTIRHLADALDAAHLTQPAQAVDAWMTDDGRVISARQKDVALRDGGASASSVAPYRIPLTAALPKDSNGAEGVGR